MKRHILLLALMLPALAYGRQDPGGTDERDSAAPAPAVDFTPQIKGELKAIGFILASREIKAPDFILKDLDGKNRSLSSYRGKLVLLNFWGVWCYYCRLEMPSLQRFYDQFKSRGVEVVTVNVRDAEATARRYIQKNKHNFPVLLDAALKVTMLYGPQGFPTTYLIDRQGKLQAMLSGFIEWDRLEVKAVFEKILAER